MHRRLNGVHPLDHVPGGNAQEGHQGHDSCWPRQVSTTAFRRNSTLNTYFYKKMGQIRPLFVYFRSFHMTNIVQIDYNEKSVDGVLGT